MQDYDPTMLRHLAGRYRKRALLEPDMSDTFLEIASEMEAHAQQLEAPASQR